MHVTHSARVYRDLPCACSCVLFLRILVSPSLAPLGDLLMQWDVGSHQSTRPWRADPRPGLPDVPITAIVLRLTESTHTGDLILSPQCYSGGRPSLHFPFARVWDLHSDLLSPNVAPSPGFLLLMGVSGLNPEVMAGSWEELGAGRVGEELGSMAREGKGG